MGAETWIPIAREFGVPAAFAVCFMVALGIIGWQVIKGVKWMGWRLFGEQGIVTRWFAKQCEMIDSIQANDHKGTAALQEICGFMQILSSKEDQHAKAGHAKLEAIHEDVKTIKNHTTPPNRPAA